MCEPSIQQGLLSPFDGSFGDAPSPGRRLAVWSLVMGLLGLVTCGLSSVPALALSLLAIKRGGWRRLTVSGLVISLIGLMFWPIFTGSYLLSEISPRYKVSYELKRVGLPPLPASATHYKYQASHGLFTGDLYVCFQCSPDDADAYVRKIRQATVQPIDVTFQHEAGVSQPAWYRPDSASRGWYISEWPWGPADEPYGYGLDVTYDLNTQTMSIYWFWS